MEQLDRISDRVPFSLENKQNLIKTAMTSLGSKMYDSIPYLRASPHVTVVQRLEGDPAFRTDRSGCRASCRRSRPTRRSL